MGMVTAVAYLKSASPYGQSRNYEMDAPKLERETHKDYESRTWRNRLHTTRDGLVFMPATGFKNCLSEAAKYLGMQIPGKGKSTYTKHLEAGVLVTEPLVLKVKAEKVDGLWLHVPASGRRGDGKRVWKCFPVLQEWEGEVTYTILDDAITEEVFRYHIEQAGKFIGLGFFRPRNNGYYGRYEVVSLKWNKG